MLSVSQSRLIYSVSQSRLIYSVSQSRLIYSVSQSRLIYTVSQSRLIYSVSQSRLIYTVCWLPRDSALSEWLWLVPAPAPPHNTAGVLTPGTGTEGRALSEETFMPITAPSSGEKTNQANFTKTLAPNEKWLWSIHFFFFVFQVLKYSIEHH